MTNWAPTSTVSDASAPRNNVFTSTVPSFITGDANEVVDTSGIITLENASGTA